MLATWGSRASEPLGVLLNALHESTPHRIRVGCMASEWAWMLTRVVGPVTLWRSWPRVDVALAGGASPITAEKYGVSPVPSVISALQVVPVLHAWPTSWPCAS